MTITGVEKLMFSRWYTTDFKVLFEPKKLPFKFMVEATVLYT